MASLAEAPRSYPSSPNDGGSPLIRLDNIRKVFLTDEVETHALSGIHVSIRRGEYVAGAGRHRVGQSPTQSVLRLRPVQTITTGWSKSSQHRDNEPAHD